MRRVPSECTRPAIDRPRVRCYLTGMQTTVSSKGQVVLPVELREQDSICAGQQFSIERLSAGEYVLKRLAVSSNRGTVEWLLACPERGWFQPLPSESTASLPAAKL